MAKNNMKDRLIETGIALGVGFAGGALTEAAMRQAYLARLQSQGTPYTETPPLTDAGTWIRLMENALGLGIGIGTTLLGIFVKGKPGTALRLLGGGSIGYVAGKLTNNVLLSTVTEEPSNEIPPPQPIRTQDWSYRYRMPRSTRHYQLYGTHALPYRRGVGGRTIITV